MRALTVRQPWAWAIVHGGKDVENRSQAWSYRGPLAIHAGLAPLEKHNMASRRHRELHGSETPTELVFGAFIGVVDLIDADACLSGTCSPWAIPGCVHLQLANSRPLARPIPCRGRLGLWTPPADVVEELQAVYVPRAPRWEPLPDPVVPTNG